VPPDLSDLISMSVLHDREPAILQPDEWELYLAGRLDRDLKEAVGQGKRPVTGSVSAYENFLFNSFARRSLSDYPYTGNSESMK
jgi:hypothetical protein